MSKGKSELSGLEKASIVMMAADRGHVQKIFTFLEDDEIRDLSHTMSSLGTISPDVVAEVLQEFSYMLSENTGFIGNIESTERLLAEVLTQDKADNIMEDLRGPAGRSTWDKVSNINEEVLATYLKNEYPQTIALIVSKIPPMQAANVISFLPSELASDVILRMLDMDSVKKEVLDSVEEVLRSEFISTIAKAQKYDSNELVAEIFNNFDRVNESRYMAVLEQQQPESALKIKKLMFVFDDLINIEKEGIQKLLGAVDKNILAIALKGASKEIRSIFLDNMSTRASKILLEDMEAMGAVKLKDVDNAQVEIINVAKDLISKSEITISQGDDDELVY